MDYSESDLFKVLANPKRLELLSLLSKHELPVCEMTKKLGVPQANISQHLMIMKRAKLVVKRKCGKSNFYRLSNDMVTIIIDMMKKVNSDRNKSPIINN